MRTAQDIVNDYRARGYTEQRIRALANNRPEPVRSEILSLLDAEACAPVEGSVSAAPTAPAVAPVREYRIESDFLRAVHQSLAPLQVERISASDYLAAQPAPEPAAVEPMAIEAPASESAAVLAEASLDAHAQEEEISEAQFDWTVPIDTAALAPLEPAAAAEPLASGEIWPVVAEVDAAVAAEPMGSVDSAVFSQEAAAAIEVAELEESHGGQRTLEVIRQGLQEDSALSEVVREEDEKIILLNPPYAAEEEAAMAEEESALIQFPSDMIASWGAIQAAQDRTPPAAVEAEEEAAAIEEEVAAIEEDFAPLAELPVAVELPVAGEEDSARIAQAVHHAEEEIARLRNWLLEVEDALKLKDLELGEFTRQLGERDETLAVQNAELARMREEVCLGRSGESALQVAEEATREARAELDAVRAQFDKVRAETESLKGETVPNLLRDKEDLMALLEEQAESRETFEHALSGSQRRLGYSYLVAAAAMAVAVLIPVLHYAHAARQSSVWDAERTALTTQAAEARQQFAAATDRAVGLDAQLAQARRETAAEREALRRKSADLARRIDDQAKEIQTLKADLAQAATPKGDAVAKADSKAPRNEMKGVEDWMRNKGEIATKTGTVRRGEGLSQVLWRELGVSNAALLEWVEKTNRLEKDTRGHPRLQVDQKIVLPADPEALGTAADAGRRGR